MPQRKGTRLARQWNREIDAEIRRLVRGRDSGPGRTVVWLALWLLWLAVLVTIIVLIRRLQW